MKLNPIQLEVSYIFIDYLNKRLFKIIIFLILLMLCSGCWDRRELDSISFVAGIGFDTGTQKDYVKLTTQLIDVSAVTAPDQGGGSAGEPFWNITAEAQTVFAALRECSDQSPRRLFFAHNQVLLFSEEVARSGIKKYLDFFQRDVEARDTVWIVISHGEASEMLSVQTRLQSVPAMNLSQLIKDRNATTHTAAVDLHDLSLRILSPTTAPIASSVEVVTTQGKKGLFLSGTAVFNKDLQMVGRLNAIETRGMLWVLGEVTGGILVIESPLCPNSKASLEILTASSKIEPQITSGKVKIVVKIQETSSLGEDTCSEDPLDPAIWDELEQRNRAVIAEEVKLAIDKARLLNSDYFGFGDAIYKKYPQEWKSMESEWKEIFPDLEVEIMVDSKIIRSGMILKPVQ